MKNLKYNIKNILGVIGTSIILLTTTGCSKKAECDINGYHAHKYVNNNNMTRYIAQEYVDYEGYTREEEYITLLEKERKLYDYLDNRNLLRIDDNEEVIREKMKENKDFYEYRYAYTYLMPLPHYSRVGKVTHVRFTYVPRTHYSWTTDANHSRLTGEKRLCTYEYTSYKIEIDEYGKYVLIPNPNKKDILSNKDEYPYIKEDYYKVITSDGKDLDYEDMKTDDVEHIQEEEKETGKVLRINKKTL